MKRALLIVVLAALRCWRGYASITSWLAGRSSANELKLSGNIEAHESLVSFKVMGRIIELPVDEGMAMKTGDLLARLDNADYRQQVAVDEVDTARARSAARSWARGQPLAGR